ncbi:RRM domain-containing protein [Mycena kentingensis (nom. inval.)]|nr:RRM domain-containing protein [Mycena kentingensis (nom. inval.)]
MSLSSLLLGKPKHVDNELDALFKSTPAPPRPAPAQPPAKKRKIEAEESTEKGKKRVKSSPEKTHKTSKKSSQKAPSPPPAESGDSDSEEEDDELETAYLRKSEKKTPVEERDSEPEVDADDSDDDADAPLPTHESLTSSAKRVRVKPAKKKLYVPADETPKQRDARTLFVGGLPVEVAEKKVGGLLPAQTSLTKWMQSLKKQLSRHVLSFLPPASQSKIRVESIRFRSAAFQKPSTSEGKDGKPAAPNPNASEHSKTRAAKWRADGDAEEAKADKKEKDYLTPAQKKKVMFINHEFHAEGRGVNAYVVLAHPGEDGDPYAAALQIARAANLTPTPFMDVFLRIDICGQPDANADSSSSALGVMGDPKLSLFVGNLEFGSQERDVMEFFEGVVAGERGPAPTEVARWVQGVRLIRDSDTQLGKGFGYVRFADRECVDEILSLVRTADGAKKLKFARRDLRVQRCKAGATPSRGAPAVVSPSKPAPRPVSAPRSKRGDPTLGDRLAHLGKDERKAAKKADKGREERRAEKKMRMRMKVKGSGPGVKSKGVEKGKDRERVRKTRVAGHQKK